MDGYWITNEDTDLYNTVLHGTQDIHLCFVFSEQSVIVFCRSLYSCYLQTNHHKEQQLIDLLQP